MEEKILISQNVIDELDDLVNLLVEKDYFSYFETAEDYVNKIYNFIYNELTEVKLQKTPKALLRHGNYFVKYSAGKRTAWYVFFNKKENMYLIKYITNNHVAKAAFLRNLIK